MVSTTPWRDITWAVFNELNDEWAQRIQLPATSSVLLDEFVNNGEQLANFVASNHGVLNPWCANFIFQRELPLLLDYFGDYNLHDIFKKILVSVLFWIFNKLSYDGS